jgi:thioredoxin-related protein
MRSARRTLLLPVLTLLALFAAAPAGAVEWLHWNDGLEAARKNGKPVIVDVYTDWCGWCKRMDAEVYARPEVSDYMAKHFVAVRLNAESGELATWEGGNYTARRLAATFGVSGYPTTIFFASSGDHLANVPGYLPRDRFMLLLRYIGDGHMDKGESFENFMKAQQPGK